MEKSRKMFFTNYSQLLSKQLRQYESSHDAHDEKVVSNLKIMLLLSFVVIGLFGNSLNCAVFGKRKMRLITTFRYLFYLSIVDLAVILTGVVHLLVRELFQYDFRLYSNFSCRCHTFMTYLTTSASSIILMAISLDRAIHVKNLVPPRMKPNNKPNDLPIANNVLTTGINEQNKIKTSDVRLDEINQCNKISIKIKYNKLNDNVAVEGNGIRVISGITIGQEKDYSIYKKINTFLSQKISVDLAVALIFIVLILLNSHFFFFMTLLAVKVETLNLFKSVTEEIKIVNFIQTDSYYYYLRCAAVSDSKYEHFLKNIWFFLDSTIYSFVPFVVMLICTIVIILQFRRLNQNYRELIMNEAYVLNRNNYIKKIKKNRKICLLLIKTNFVFFASMFQYWVFFFKFKGYKNKNSFYLNNLRSFSHVLLYIINVFNFVIFGLSSQKYREEFLVLFTNPNNDRFSSSAAKTYF